MHSCQKSYELLLSDLCILDYSRRFTRSSKLLLRETARQFDFLLYPYTPISIHVYVPMYNPHLKSLTLIRIKIYVKHDIREILRGNFASPLIDSFSLIVSLFLLRLAILSLRVFLSPLFTFKVFVFQR